MANRNTEQDAAPERSVTGENTADTTVDAAENIPEQEQMKENTQTESDTAATEADETPDVTEASEPTGETADSTDSHTDTDAAAADAVESDEIIAAAEEPVLRETKPQWWERIPADARETICDVLDTCESVIVAMFVVLMIFTYLFSVAVVEGDSMLPTLRDADRLLLINFAAPEQGDIVVLNSESSYTFDENGNLTKDNGLGKKIVKRLIATENQTVDIDFAAGIVYVDGNPLDEPYTGTLTTRDEGAFVYPITVPEGYVFVLGDNRSVSKDSRHPDVGLIPEDDIVGKVWLRVYPFDDFMAVG